jgi:diguanylate cyclase (GGDEF)-like protein
MDLDPRTLAAAAAFATIVQVVAMLYVWRIQFRERAVAELTLAALVVVCSAGLALSRPHLPPAITHAAAIGGLIFGHFLGVLAIRRFVGKPFSLWFVIGLPALSGLLATWFLLVDPRLDMRIAIYTLAVTAASLLIAWTLLDVPRGPLRATHWPVGVIHLISAALGIARFFAVLTGDLKDDVFAPSLLSSLWFLQALVVVNLTFTGVILMITQRLRLELDRQASYDELTSALNRRAFERVAEAEWSRAARHGQSLSILALDLDRFKQLNDGHGHEAGDIWLRAFSGLVHGLLRREDVLCRQGGDEFLALLPQTPLDAARQAAERIRRGADGLRVVHNGAELAASVSIGVATRDGATATLQAAIAAADQALYQAKAKGRNLVETAEGS